MKHALQSKVSGDSDGSNLNPLVKIKEAIQTLQKEIHEMYITTNFLNHELLQTKKKANVNRLIKMKKKKKQRRQRGRFSNKNADNISSDDELDESMNA